MWVRSYSALIPRVLDLFNLFNLFAKTNKFQLSLFFFVNFTSSGQPIPHGGYHQAGNIGDPALPFRPVYPPTRLFPGSPSTILPPPPPPPHQASYMYTSPSYPSQYSPHGHHPANDYFLGHVLSGNNQYGSPNHNYAAAAPRDSSYTCIGAPVGHAFPPSGGGGGGRGSDVEASSGGRGGGRDVSLQHLDPASNNRFQDGF